MAYQNILVGIDGSKQSEMAFDKAVEIAKQNNAKLHLISVVNGERYPNTDTVGYGFVDQSIYEAATKRMKKTLDHFKDSAEKDGVKEVTATVKIGNAKVEVAEEYPKKNNIDLIVVGATGLNMVGRVIVGSTAAYVVRVAPCDVIVVKTDHANHTLNIKSASYPQI